MSYILDALRRADAERERGAIPGLHSQNFPTGDDPPEARSRLPAWVWVLMGVCALLLGALLWLWLVGGEAKPEPRVASAPLPVTEALPAPTPAMPAAPALAAPSSATPAPATDAAARPQSPPMPAAGHAPRDAVPTGRPGASTQSAPAPPASSPSPAAQPNPRPAGPAAQRELRKPLVPEPVAELRAPPLSALPENLRRELPTMMVGGSVYAKTPANRILILNGQPFHEGDSPMSELVLEQIKLKSAVLKYKGQRFELSY
jgi:general secretion pathway protein B